MRSAVSTRCTRSSNAPPPPPPNATAAVPLVNLMIDVPTLERYLAGTGDTVVPADPRQRRCETVSGIPVPASDVVAAMMWGHVRRVVVDSAGVVINMGRRRRLFTGNARQAILLQSSRCVVAGCATPIRRCEADHMTEWGRHGLTDGPNGAPMCGRHNRLKNTGYRVASRRRRLLAHLPTRRHRNPLTADPQPVERPATNERAPTRARRDG